MFLRSKKINELAIPRVKYIDIKNSRYVPLKLELENMMGICRMKNKMLAKNELDRTFFESS